MPTTTLDIDYCDSGDLARYHDELLAVYADAYADKVDSPFFTPERYWERVEAYASRDGYSLVLGRIDGELVGYAMGFTLPAGSAWWNGLTTSVDPALTTEDGRRTFALTYMMVRVAYRRRGYARALHDALLQDRREQRAALLVLPENVPARTAYRAWGWYLVGELQPFSDAPVYDAMVLDLQRCARSEKSLLIDQNGDSAGKWLETPRSRHLLKHVGDILRRLANKHRIGPYEAAVPSFAQAMRCAACRVIVWCSERCFDCWRL